MRDLLLPRLILPLPSHDPTGGETLITSPYGYRPSTNSFHYGDDWGTDDGIDVGTDVHAVEDGIVIRAGDSRPNAAGIFIWLLGDSGYGWKFFHLNDFDPRAVGYRVRRGQVIGHVGNTGTRVAHLHLQCHAVNNSRDPGDWTDASAVSVTNIWRELISQGRWPNNPPPPPPEDDMPYNDWPTEDRRALVDDVTRGVSFKEQGAASSTVSTQDLRAYMVAQTNLLAAIAEKLGIQITWNQGVPIPQP